MARDTKTWLFFAAVNGLVAVAAGAFAAHGLARSGKADAVRLFGTAAHYQSVHALALLAVAWLSTLEAPRARGLVRWTGLLFSAGLVLFSGSLYALALTDLKPFAYVTPVGGLAFLVGWGCLALTALRLE